MTDAHAPADLDTGEPLRVQVVNLLQSSFIPFVGHVFFSLSILKGGEGVSCPGNPGA
jgi:hypothetical protein